MFGWGSTTRQRDVHQQIRHRTGGDQVLYSAAPFPVEVRAVGAARASDSRLEAGVAAPRLGRLDSIM